nr:PREDICTED: atrial natriuretic peptide-converting enzyme-like [Latimeria chalumnae]|eukprot:XP_006012285.1 PREDICTED: atrial natriuretic peptide-converting enzyme-like [Latimeria chalumnae]
MLSMQQFTSLSSDEQYQHVRSNHGVLGTDEDNMGDDCSPKLESAKHLRLLLLILIPCICTLICLLVILLAFVGSNQERWLIMKPTWNQIMKNAQ